VTSQCRWQAMGFTYRSAAISAARCRHQRAGRQHGGGDRPVGLRKVDPVAALNRLHEPDSGDILLDGQSVLKDDPNTVRLRIGMVFQHFNLFRI